MINIRPVSDLRNKFPEIEETVIGSNAPVFLTKNGYGTMVLMSIEQYSLHLQMILIEASMKQMLLQQTLLSAFLNLMSLIK